MVKIRTRPDGTKYPINGKKGRVGVAVTAAAAIMIATYSGGGSAITTSGASSAAGESISTRVSTGKQAARKGQRAKAWQRMRLKVTRNRSHRHGQCAPHSFGQVRKFFARSPCRSLTRTLTMFADEHGNTGVVSIAWVRMRTTRATHALNRLDYRDGTGDVAALGGGVLADQGVSFTGEHYRSRVSRTLFVRAEAAPLSGKLEPELLDGVAAMAAQFPPP